jgi:iron complex outermembrane recepter protein
MICIFRRNRQTALVAAAGVALLAGMAVNALAADAPAAARTASSPGKESGELEEVVVTGTLIRGVAPVGSNVVNVSRADIEASGVVDANMLLNQLVPQSNNFMQVQQIGRNVSLGIPRVPVMRPNLRDLGDENSASGSPTLVMLDGHRIVPAGITQSTTDVGMIPPGMIERQEIVLDGTSAVYGSDAVGGTINYISRKRFDETRASIQYGVADSYNQRSADITSGRKWATGGIGFSYSFSKNTDLHVGDRDYALPRNYLLPGNPFTGLACDGYSHVTIGSGATARTFVTPTVTPATFTEQRSPCALPYGVLFGGQELHTGSVTFSQDLSDRVKLDVTGFYSNRKTSQNGGPFTGTLTIRPTNPYFQSIPGVPAASQATQSVAFSYGPVLGNDASASPTALELWQLSPTLTIGLGKWQARVLLSYGESQTIVDQKLLDTALANGVVGGTTLATAINPYNIAATQNLALVSGLVYTSHTQGNQKYDQLRAIADGPLFALPGGDMTAAIGAETSKTDLRTQQTNAATHLVLPFASTSQTNQAVFAELNAPLVGTQNSRTGIRALTFSLSARYDRYDDFGNTFNPKVAFTYKPVDWVTVRGNYGKSFRAPNVADKLAITNGSFFCVGTSIPGCTNFPITLLPGQTLPPGNNVIMTLTGTVADLHPETAKNWSFGLDISPPIVPNLTVSGTYWHINFTDAIALPPNNVAQAYTGGLANLVTLNPTAAQITALGNTVPNGSAAASLVQSAGYNVLYIYDDRTRNLSARKVDGLDVAMRYNHPTSFGSLDASVNGAWVLRNDTALAPGAPFTDSISTGTPYNRVTLGVGANVENFRAQATMQHQSGYPVPPSANQCTCQTRIDSFDLVNLSFSYNGTKSGAALQDFRLTLTINNVLDKDPPVAMTTTGTTANGSTLGRLVQFGIEKKF